MGKLTANQVKNLVEAGTYEDGDGLRLLVKPSGRKNWVLRFQLNGKRREMGLGSYPQLDLKKARAAAYENKVHILNGTDPLAKRQAEQAAQREATRRELAQLITFEKLATDYRDAHGSSWSEKWRKGWLRKLELDAFPTIGKLSADQIDTKHLIKALQPLWSTKTRTADEIRGQIEQILDAARARGLRTGENPARWRGHLENLLSRHEKKKARKRQHHPALKWQDLPKLMEALLKDPSHSDVMDAYFFQSAHCGNSYPFLTALQQPIRLAISMRQPAPVSFSRKETGAPTAAAAQLVQGFAAFPLVTIGVTNTASPATAMQMMVPQPKEWTAPD